MVKVPILQHLENLRDEELEERREKRRKQLAEEEETKQNERRASGAEQVREQSLQVCRKYTQVSGIFEPVGHILTALEQGVGQDKMFIKPV